MSGGRRAYTNRLTLWLIKSQIKDLINRPCTVDFNDSFNGSGRFSL